MVAEDSVLPLPWLRAPLDDVLQRQRGHALLVHGAPGVGVLEFALALAQAWLCEAPSGSLPCGRCASCRLVQSRTHPDLKLRVPEELALAIGWPIIFDDKRKPSRQIKIDEVREAIDWIVTTPGRGRAKVLVVHPAEAMHGPAASALLKTLEEPPAYARIVLCAAEPASLMPTVRSRCQLTVLAVPAANVALAWLGTQGVQSVQDATVLLAGAGGRPLDALALHREGVTAAVWASLPRSVVQGQVGALAGWPVARTVDALQKLCHDAMVAAAGGTPVFFPPDAVPAHATLPALGLWQRSLQRVRRHAEHPWSEALLVESLVAEGRVALAAPLKTLPKTARGAETALDTLA